MVTRDVVKKFESSSKSGTECAQTQKDLDLSIAHRIGFLRFKGCNFLKIAVRKWRKSKKPFFILYTRVLYKNFVR